MSTTTTTVRDRGDHYGPIEWAQWRGPQTYWPATTQTHHPYHLSQVLWRHRACRSIHPWTTAEQLGPVWPPYRGTGTTDQADLVKRGSAQLDLMSLHSTLVWQLLTVEHKIDGHGDRSWRRQRSFDKPHDDELRDEHTCTRCGIVYLCSWLHVMCRRTSYCCVAARSRRCRRARLVSSHRCSGRRIWCRRLFHEYRAWPCSPPRYHSHLYTFVLSCYSTIIIIIFSLMKSRQNARYTCARLSRRTENNTSVCQTHDDGIYYNNASRTARQWVRSTSAKSKG